jgi:lysophospholipase L1-like esterase
MGKYIFSSRLTAILCMVLCITVASINAAESPVRPGDHVAFVGNTFADQLRSHGYLETLLLQRSAGNPVSIRNLGWAGDMLSARDRPTNFPTEASTLEAHKTDVIIACFGMGESFAGKAGLAEFKKQLNAFIASHRARKYNGRSAVRLVLVSPIAYENLGARTPRWQERNREISAYGRLMNETAANTGVPFIDLYGPTAELMEGKDTPKLTDNGINLNAYGYWCVSRALADALLPGTAPWVLSVDAKSGKSLGRGARVSQVKFTTAAMAFTVQELNWPSLAAPVKGQVHPQLKRSLDQLRVMNLKPGNYRLLVDGKPVATASHIQWAAGLGLNSTPAHADLESYRKSIYDKNAHFVYSWKALNQVHIVGERRKSPSGRALPAEVIEFNKLTNQKDEALSSGIRLKTRQWQLVPAAPLIP